MTAVIVVLSFVAVLALVLILGNLILKGASSLDWAFFTKSPQAYFLDSVKAAVESRRTPPDWWRDLRKQELARERDHEQAKADILAETSGRNGFRRSRARSPSRSR